MVKEGIDVGGLVVDTDESAASTGVALIVIREDGTGKRTVSCAGSNDATGDTEVAEVRRYMDPTVCPDVGK